jgi:hypothetical protein
LIDIGVVAWGLIADSPGSAEPLRWKNEIFLGAGLMDMRLWGDSILTFGYHWYFLGSSISAIAWLDTSDEETDELSLPLEPD